MWSCDVGVWTGEHINDQTVSTYPSSTPICSGGCLWYKNTRKKKKWSSNEVVSESEVEQAFFFFLFSLKFHTLVKNLKAGEKVKTSQRIWTLCLLTYFDTKKKVLIHHNSVTNKNMKTKRKAL